MIVTARTFLRRLGLAALLRKELMATSASFRLAARGGEGGVTTKVITLLQDVAFAGLVDPDQGDANVDVGPGGSTYENQKTFPYRFAGLKSSLSSLWRSTRIRPRCDDHG